MAKYKYSGEDMYSKGMTVVIMGMHVEIEAVAEHSLRSWSKYSSKLKQDISNFQP